MSYPKDLEEYTDAELRAELDRRNLERRNGNCSYCKRPLRDAPQAFPAADAPVEECRYHERYLYAAGGVVVVERVK